MSAGTTGPGLFEVRFYTARPGRRDELVRYLDDVVIPFNVERGVAVVGSFVDQEHDDVYVWIRRFDDEEDRTRRYAAVYEDPRWTEEIAPVVTELMFRERAVVTRASPTPRSPLQ